MISSLNHSLSFRAMKLLHTTEWKARDTSVEPRGAWPLVRAAGRRRAVMTGRFYRGAAVGFRIPILSLTVADVGGVSCRNFMPFPTVFRFFALPNCCGFRFCRFEFFGQKIVRGILSLLCFAFVGGL